MIEKNNPTSLGGRTLVYLILKHAKFPIYLIVFMIAVTYCVSHWDKNILVFFKSSSFIAHYFAVSLYNILKYGWLLSSALFLCFGVSGYLEYINTKITLSDLAFTVSTGLINKKEITIPFSQVETINISTNPNLEMFGLCSFVVKTSAQNNAGVSSENADSDATLPFVPKTLAKKLQSEILSVSSSPRINQVVS